MELDTSEILHVECDLYAMRVDFTILILGYAVLDVNADATWY